MSRAEDGPPADLLRAALLFFVCAFATAWARPLMLPDEGRYAGVAWDMLHSGDWTVPALNGLPFFHKPPMFYWIGAASMALFGVHAWAARAASVLGAWLAVMGIYAFVARWRGTHLARPTAVVLLAQPLWLVGGQFANLDMLVAGCISATILLAAHAALCRDSGQPYKPALAAAYASAGLGVLAKGLIGLVLPGMVVLLWLLAQRRGRTLRPLLWGPGWLLMLAITVPWFALMQSRYPQFLHYFFVVQHFQRFAGAGFNNVQAWWFYPVLLVLCHGLWLPWLRRLFSAAAMSEMHHDPVHALMLVWLAVVVVFFSLPQSKLIGYVLPALPPLAFLIGARHAALPARGTRLQRWWPVAAALSTMVALACIGWLSWHPIKSTKALALVLKAEHRTAEPVIMLRNYYYDVPFYAGLREPVAIVDAWDAATPPATDNWRKEIADAAAFAPAQAQHVLLLKTQLAATVCAMPVSWLIGSPDEATAFAFLTPAQERYRDAATVLWRVDRAAARVANALACDGMPNAD